MAKPKAASRGEQQKLRSALLGACFLLSVILLVVYTCYVVFFSGCELLFFLISFVLINLLNFRCFGCAVTFWRSNRAVPPVADAKEKITEDKVASSRQEGKLTYRRFTVKSFSDGDANFLEKKP